MIDNEYESGYIEDYESGYIVPVAEENKIIPVPEKVSEKDLRDIVDNKALELASNIITSQEPNDLTAYINEFNNNMSKKNILRLLKMNELWDKVSDEAVDRIQNHSDELTHAEIINYLRVTKESIDNINKGSDQVSLTQPITLNQQTNTVNVNIESSEQQNIRIDRRSKEKVMEAVSKLLNISLQTIQSNQNNEEEIIEAEIKENN